MHSDRTCPECKAAMLEQIGHSTWYYCACCSVRVLFDAAGAVVKVLQK